MTKVLFLSFVHLILGMYGVAVVIIIAYFLSIVLDTP